MTLSVSSINWWPAVLPAVLLSPEDEDRALQEGHWMPPRAPAARAADSDLQISVP
jgi:hypothetical protein